MTTVAVSTPLIGVNTARVTDAADFAVGTPVAIAGNNVAVYVVLGEAADAGERVNLDSSFETTNNATGTHVIATAGTTGQYTWATRFASPL